MRLDIRVDRERWLRGSNKNRKRIINARNKTALDLANSVRENAMILAPYTPSFSSGELKASFVVLKTRVGYSVVSLSAYAWYVENGTGVYNSFGIGRKTPWVYKSRTGRFYTTRGQKAQFFFKRALELTTIRAPRILQTSFKGV